MSLPKEFILIDRIIHYHPDLASILRDPVNGLDFAMDAKELEKVMRYQSKFVANWSPLLVVKKGDIMKYKGYKIHAV